MKKEEDVGIGFGGSAVELAGAPYLFDGEKLHRRCGGDVCRGIGASPVDDDDFAVRFEKRFKAVREMFLFVECRDDDGEISHGI